MKTITALILVLGSSCAFAQVGHYSLGHRDEAKAIEASTARRMLMGAVAKEMLLPMVSDIKVPIRTDWIPEPVKISYDVRRKAGVKTSVQDLAIHSAAIALGFNISPNIHITSKKITYTVQF